MIDLTMTRRELEYVIAKLGGPSNLSMVRPSADSINAEESMALVSRLSRARTAHDQSTTKAHGVCRYCGGQHPSFDCPGLDEMVPLPTPMQTEKTQ